MTNDKEQLIALCDTFVRTHPYQQQRWGWGEGLIAFALMQLDETLRSKRYFDYVKNYCLFHYEKGIQINSSDTVCPCLASLELYKQTKEPVYKEITDLGVQYIKTSQKILEGIPNHFGSSSSYPQSIWVDSLMMLSVFTSRYAKEFNDDELMAYAKSMPAVFARYLQHDNGLWHHSYWTNEQKPYPANLYWGRGNGWVCQSFPMIAQIGDDQNEIKTIYQKTIDAMIKKQCSDGSFRTILNRRESYKETSATALFASGIYLGIQTGLLDEDYRCYGDRAYNYLRRKTITNSKGTYLTGISRPTVPAQRFPYLYYMEMIKKSNFNYGVAAMIFATINKGALTNGKEEGQF